MANDDRSSCSHQYWDMGRCARCMKTQDEISKENHLNPESCPHLKFEANVNVGRFEDTGRFMADITVRCASCGEKFRFLGPTAGINWERPSVSIDGLEMRAPIEPEGEPRLLDRATFQMPPVPKQN